MTATNINTRGNKVVNCCTENSTKSKTYPLIRVKQNALSRMDTGGAHIGVLHEVVKLVTNTFNAGAPGWIPAS